MGWSHRKFTFSKCRRVLKATRCNRKIVERNLILKWVNIGFKMQTDLKGVINTAIVINYKTKWIEPQIIKVVWRTAKNSPIKNWRSTKINSRERAENKNIERFGLKTILSTQNYHEQIHKSNDIELIRRRLFHRQRTVFTIKPIRRYQRNQRCWVI